MRSITYMRERNSWTRVPSAKNAAVDRAPSRFEKFHSGTPAKKDTTAHHGALSDYREFH